MGRLVTREHTIIPVILRGTTRLRRIILVGETAFGAGRRHPCPLRIIAQPKEFGCMFGLDEPPMSRATWRGPSVEVVLSFGFDISSRRHSASVDEEGPATARRSSAPPGRRAT